MPPLHTRVTLRYRRRANGIQRSPVGPVRSVPVGINRCRQFVGFFAPRPLPSPSAEEYPPEAHPASMALDLTLAVCPPEART